MLTYQKNLKAKCQVLLFQHYIYTFIYIYTNHLQRFLKKFFFSNYN